ncbi:MAG TPA: hypothetical protein VEA38_00875 [Terriglobales bacterium]|nr:hypothetical protein [Terriglobales bacterium]
MTETIRYSLIGAQDIKFGTGTFEVTLADGRVVVLEAINAGHISGATTGSTANETVNATMLDVYRARRGLTGLLDFDQDDSTTTGLTWGYKNGMAGDGSGAIAAGTVTLTANSTNYVEWDPETGAISVNTSAFSPTDKVPIRKLVTNASAITTNTDVRPIWRQNVNLLHGQCYLSWVSASSIKLLPLNGNRLIINGTTQTIPAAGVSLSNSGLTTSTTYYLYAYMNGSTMTLEASTTAHATSSTDGVEIKSGDQTRTFVGEVDVDGSGNFEADIRQWFVPAATGAADARTNVVAYPLTVDAPTSGTPAAGIGTGVRLRAESADEAPSDVATFEGVFTDVTAGSEDSYASIKLRVAGRALDEKYRFSSTAGDGFAALFTHAVTADRTYTLPDRTGNILTSTGLTKVELIRKTSDESVTSSTTLQNDDALTCALAANEFVRAELTIYFTAAAAGDIKFGFTVPAAATIYWGTPNMIFYNSADAVTASDIRTTGSLDVGFISGGTICVASLEVAVLNGANAGNLTLQWAQNASSGTPTTVKAMSHMLVFRE